jgi:hypothetical protein
MSYGLTTDAYRFRSFRLIAAVLLERFKHITRARIIQCLNLGKSEWERSVGRLSLNLNIQSPVFL